MFALHCYALSCHFFYLSLSLSLRRTFEIQSVCVVNKWWVTESEYLVETQPIDTFLMFDLTDEEKAKADLPSYLWQPKDGGQGGSKSKRGRKKQVCSLKEFYV